MKGATVYAFHHASCFSIFDLFFALFSFLVISEIGEVCLSYLLTTYYRTLTQVWLSVKKQRKSLIVTQLTLYLIFSYLIVISIDNS